MLLQCCNCAPSSQNTFFLVFSRPKTHLSSNFGLGRFRNPKRPSSKFTCAIKLGFEDIAEIVHNKVLISAGVSAAVGQLSKPFTGSLLYGRSLDLKASIQAGGFPSTHSSSVVAAATCLALERGFADSFFGLTLVYAGLVMYDAQGVRREVGIHAKTLNNLLSKTQQVNSTVSQDIDNVIDCQQGDSSKLKMDSLGPTPFSSTNVPPLLLNQTKQMLMSSVEEGSERSGDINSAVLKESIGHTEVEVIAGAFLGFFVSLAVYAIVGTRSTTTGITDGNNIRVSARATE
ncbi:uncharacterized protein LOC116142074 isoform X3 [Pistacia vera]|uniref:uncharacterized protein LOC116142074 isoform X3 n=1 Tax=Pistacia vera TaxID=55513 RepID=UPI001263D7DD|nr:uncharacterized protein LOC116142074 isoform X3 [Pistacia vera]